MSRKALAAGECVNDKGKTPAASAMRFTIGLAPQVKRRRIMAE